jgi:hypothetical protein
MDAKYFKKLKCAALEVTILLLFPSLFLSSTGYAPVDLHTKGITFEYEQVKNQFRSINYLEKPIKIENFCFLNATTTLGKIEFNRVERFGTSESVKLSWYSPNSCRVADSWSRKYFYLELEPDKFLHSLNATKQFLDKCINCNTNSAEIMEWILNGDLHNVSVERGWHVFAKRKLPEEGGVEIVYRETVLKTEALKISSSFPLEQLDLYDGE